MTIRHDKHLELGNLGELTVIGDMRMNSPNIEYWIPESQGDDIDYFNYWNETFDDREKELVNRFCKRRIFKI